MRSSVILKTYFGRSWRLELKMNSKGTLTRVPFVFSMTFSKEINPESGMTVNLVTVDRWFKELESLRSKTWKTPENFLQAANQILVPLWKSENTSNEEVSLTSLSKHSWKISDNKNYFVLPVSYFEKTSEGRSRRMALITCTNDEQQEIKKVEILDLFQTKTEFEINL